MIGMKKTLLIIGLHILFGFYVCGQSIVLEPNSGKGAIQLGNGSKGISIGQVSLESITSMSPFTELAAGSIVYNIADNSVFKPGLYLWDGTDWNRLVSENISSVPQGAIIERDQKLDMPGYTYYGYQYHSNFFYTSIGRGYGTWISLPNYPYDASIEEPSSVFYAGNFFVWSGKDNSYASYDQTGAYYNPTTNTWTAMNTTNAPEGRWGNTTVLDQSDGYMLIWGGVTSMISAGAVPVLTATGGIYDVLYPTSDWISMPAAPISARYRHTAVLTNGLAPFKMIIWGGSDASGTALGDGAVFTRATNTWASLPACPLSPRYGHTAVWTGSLMIVYGGTNGTQNFRDGAAYDPVANTWTLIADSGFGPMTFDHVAVWTGTEMIVFGGASQPNGSFPTNLCLKYNPSTDTWLSAATAPGAAYGFGAFYGQNAIWTGTEMVVLGGKNSTSNGTNVVKKYNPTTNTWSILNTLPEYKKKPALAWSGTKILLQSGSWYDSSGYYFDPDTGTPQDVDIQEQKIIYKYKKD